jgi:hypothetical protein
MATKKIMVKKPKTIKKKFEPKKPKMMKTFDRKKGWILVPYER